ncbi:MAG: MBL fold metallo-hydrolase [Ruminococcus sp.]|nr:MBL fold metallo-hydrolase [Ruminococcus sp.]
MKMMFIGANHEVTGSCTYIEACGKRFLVDFGMEQGFDEFENVQIPCNPSQIDFVLLTHAHIDHSGLLPLLYAGGFRGEIHATKATAHLCDIMLRDSAHIQEFEAEWKNRRGKRENKEEYIPLYNIEDALGAIFLFVEHEYGVFKEISDGLMIRFTDAGHLLGSASIEIKLYENGVKRKLVFSGDIGNKDQPLIKDPTYIDSADFVVMESTYGDRLHHRPTDYVAALAQVLRETFEKGGNVVIPSFAVGRTQELLYFIKQIKDRGLIAEYSDFPVFVDSPLAIEATNIFMKNYADCFDDEAMDYIDNGINPIKFDGLNIAVSADESRAINFDKRPKVIISSSGMCEAGRIKHHLKHNLWRPECTVMFVGYQAVNTLGRKLADGAKIAKLFGEEISVNARVLTLPGISGHADKNGLDAWIGAIDGVKRVFVNHGEDKVSTSYAEHLTNDLGIDAVAPYSGAMFDLVTEVYENGSPVRNERKYKAEPHTVYGRLVAAVDSLEALVKDSKGRTNKDLAKLTDSINNLIQKFK